MLALNFVCGNLVPHLLQLLLGINMKNCTKFINKNNPCICKGLLVYEQTYISLGSVRSTQKAAEAVIMYLQSSKCRGKFYSKSAGALPEQPI